MEIIEFMRILASVLLVPILYVALAHAQTSAEMKAAGDAERAATAAYRIKSNAEFLQQMEIANRNRPNHPRLIYNLATAYALNGRTDESLDSLERLTKMGLSYAFEKNEDLGSVREHARFKGILSAAAANRNPVNVSTPAFRLSDRSLIAESVGYDPRSKQFFVGSVHQRKILSIDPSGREFSSAADGLYAVMGIKVDSDRGILWAATSAVPQMRGYSEADKGRSGVFKYDLTTRKLLGKYMLPAGEQHTIGDVWIDKLGKVFATDSASPNIYRIDDSQNAIIPFIASDLFVSLQGLTGGATANEMYVADYSKGLFRIDMATKVVTQLKPDVNVTLLGIDGLYFHEGRLIAIQNGVAPTRVVAFSVEGDRVASTTVLEANHPDFLEPTLGVVSGDDLYYIANSQWPLVNEKAELQLEKLRDPVVLKLSLKPARLK